MTERQKANIRIMQATILDVLRYPDAARVLVRPNGKFFDILRTELRTELREKAHEMSVIPAYYELSTEEEIKW